MSLLPDARRLMQKLRDHKLEALSISLHSTHGGLGASESDITVPVWIVIGLPTDGDAATGAESTQQLSSEGNTLHTHTHTESGDTVLTCQLFYQ